MDAMGYDPTIPPFHTENYEVRKWTGRRRWYVVNRMTNHCVGSPFDNRAQAERWMMRCQDDYDAGRTIGRRR